MISGRTDSEGQLYITTVVPNELSTLQGGIALTSLGQVHLSTSTPTLFANGFGVTPVGQLCHSAGGTIDGWQQGFPFDADGALVTQLDAVPVTTDPYVGGVRVGEAGVYITSTVPEGAFAFDSGFSEGFA